MRSLHRYPPAYQRLENRIRYYKRESSRRRVQGIHIVYDLVGFIPLDKLTKEETA